MTTDSLRWEYTARLNRVINYIDEHLDEPLSLQELAQVAAFSPFHFHRIFKALTGETLGAFVWRLRLERAANLLLGQPTTRVTPALACGFSSHSNFSRAFKARFGVSATEFRSVGQRDPSLEVRKHGEGNLFTPTYPPGCRHDAERSLNGGQDMVVEVKTLPSYHVAYIRRLGYSKGEFQEHLSAAFQQVCRWAADRDLYQPDTLIIGVPHDNPDIAPNARCRYDACITIPADVTQGSANVNIQDLPGGKHAVQRIDVKDPAEIGRLVDAMYGEWCPQAAIRPTTGRPWRSTTIVRSQAPRPESSWTTVFP